MDQPGLVELLIIPARQKRVMGRLLQGMSRRPAKMAPGLTSVVLFNRAEWADEGVRPRREKDGARHKLCSMPTIRRYK